MKHRITFPVGNGGGFLDMTWLPEKQHWRCDMNSHAYGQVASRIIFNLHPSALEPLYWMAVHAVTMGLPQTTSHAAGRDLKHTRFTEEKTAKVKATDLFDVEDHEEFILGGDHVTLEQGHLLMRIGYDQQLYAWDVGSNPRLRFTIEAHVQGAHFYNFEHEMSLEGATELMRAFLSMHHDTFEVAPELLEEEGNPMGILPPDRKEPECLRANRAYEMGYFYSPHGRLRRQEYARLATMRYALMVAKREQAERDRPTRKVVKSPEKKVLKREES